MKLLLLSLLATTAYSTTYCGGGNMYPGDANLGAVKLAGLVDDTNDCDMKDIVDMTGIGAASLSTGSKYTAFVTVTKCGNALDRVAGVFIDFKGDGNFVAVAPDQKVTPAQADPVELKFEFEVPSDAGSVSDEARMRVIVAESLGTAPMEPCGAFGFGGVKDYKVTFGGGIDGGGIFLILLTVFVFLYIAGGCFYLRKYKGATSSSDACLHGDFWSSLPVYVKEGCLYTRRKLFSKSTGSDAADAFQEL